MGIGFLSALIPAYGVTLMASLLGIQKSDFTKQKVRLLAAFAAVVAFVNVAAYLRFGHVFYGKFYLLLIQLPVYILFHILSRHRGIKLLFTMLTAITLAALPVHMVIIVRVLSKNNVGWIATTFVLTCLVMVYITHRWLRPNFVYILEFGEGKDFFKFCIIPLLYYIYTYMSSGYNFSQYTNLDSFFVRRIPDLIVFISYVLLVDIFKSTHEKQMLQNEHALLALQIEAADRQINFLETAQDQAKIYRHDMRHHFSLIYNFLADGDVQKAKTYIEQAQADIDAITPVRYCENNSVNLILSAFEEKAQAAGITLLAQVVLPARLPIPATEVCAVLSNGLENAIAATALVQGAAKEIRLRCSIRANNLIVSIENPYSGTVTLENGLPHSDREGHGFGSKSMAAIAEKRHGLYACEVNAGVFALQIVLPLGAATT